MLTPYQFMLSEIAGRYGKDKETWDNRVLFTLLHRDKLESLTPTAKEPILFEAAVRALRDIENGNPTGYGCMFDCTASGMQLLSILTGDIGAAAICNVTGVNTPTDPYTAIYTAMNKKLGVGNTLERDDVKQAILTSLYGSEAEPEKIFNDTELGVFFETMGEVTPLCWELNQYLLNFQKTSDALSYTWVMPDNFHVNSPVMEKVKEQVECLGRTYVVTRKVNQAHPRSRALGANMTHSVESFVLREYVRRTNLSKKVRKTVEEALDNPIGDTESTMVDKLWELYEESGYLSARILEYINENTLKPSMVPDIQKLLDSCSWVSFPTKCTHDCLSTHPNNASELLKVYREQYALLSESDMLSYLLSQILEEPVELSITKFGDEIRKATNILS